MPPRKRKPVLAPIIEQEAADEVQPIAEKRSPELTQQQQRQPASNEELAAIVHEKIREIDRAVEQRCQAILLAVQEIVSSLTQEIRLELLRLPKKAREMSVAEYLEQQGGAAGPTALEAVQQRMEQMKQAAAASMTAAATTRTTRSRAAGSAQVPATQAAAPRTTRRGKAAAAAASAAASATADEDTENLPPARAAAAAVGAAAAAKLDLARPPGTAMRRAQQGEILYSANGSPIIIGSASAAAAAAPPALPGPSKPALTTPAVPHLAAQLHAPSTAMLGAFTLVKKEPAARRGGARGRARKQQAEGDAETAIMIATADGSQFMVDGGGSLASIPEQYRAEVQQQLATLQRLTAMALGGKLI